MPPLFTPNQFAARGASVKLQQPIGPSILDRIGNAQVGPGNGGFAEGESDLMDWLNLFGGDVPIAGDILGLVSRQSQAKRIKDEQSQVNAANEKRYGQRLDLNTQQQGLANDQLNTTGQFLFDRLGRAGDSYKAAEGQLTQAGSAATRSILDNQTAQMGAAAQGARSRGFFNSSPLGDQQRGIIADTGRAIGDVNANVGLQKANFGARKADSIAGLEGDLANFMTGRTRFQTGLLGDRSQVVNDRTDTANFGAMLPYLASAKGGSSGGGGSSLGGLLGGVGKLFGGGLF